MSKGIISNAMIILAVMFGLVVVGSGIIAIPTAEILGGNITCSSQPLYGFVSCVTVPATSVTEEIRGGYIGQSYIAKLCPATSDISNKGCLIDSDTGTGLRVGSNCKETTDFFGTVQFDCINSRTPSPTSGALRGEYIYRLPYQTTDAGKRGQVTYTVYKKQLQDCGLAGCTGGGVPVQGAAGCTWKSGLTNQEGKPIIGFIDQFFNSAIDTVPEGQGAKYQAGSISSCTSLCTQNIDCRPPADANRAGSTLYNGQQVNWYSFGTQGYYLGCQQKQYCSKTDVLGSCLEQKSYGQCGTLAAFSTGSCSQNSDCGDVTRFSCDFNSLTLQGTCKPKEEVPVQQCVYDFQCTQTGITCNAKQKGTQSCVSGSCQTISYAVQCCSVSDCGSGQFCNSNNACEGAPVQVSPTGTPLPTVEPKKDIDIIAALIGGLILAVIIILTLVVIGLFIKLPYLSKLTNPKTAIIAIVVLGIIFAVIFAAQSMSAAQLVIG